MKKFLKWVSDIIKGSDNNTLNGAEVIAEDTSDYHILQDPRGREVPALVLC